VSDRNNQIEEGMICGIDSLLSLKTVGLLLSKSVRSVWRMIADGELPQPVYVGRSARLPASEVQAYIERRKQNRKQ
jgi:excisionase family DNA binding protein